MKIYTYKGKKNLCGDRIRIERLKKRMTQMELAAKIQSLFNAGRSDLYFVIGGSLGLHDNVLRRADEKLGLSRLTFPHQLARAILAEQLYRAVKINAGQRYHK